MIFLTVIFSILSLGLSLPVLNNDDSAIAEQGKYFEGDMLLSPEQRRAISEALDSRNGLRDDAKRWPNRTVVYYIEDDDFDEEQIEIIEEAMADIANKSCLSFRPKQTDEHHVKIQVRILARVDIICVMNTQVMDVCICIEGTASGCFSNVGLSSDDDGEVNQVLNLAKGCFKHGTVVHEMLHTLGFYHMQSTHDRDEYVTIVWENISAGTEHNFAKYTNNTVDDFGVKYDYGSVMHYPEKAFSKNGERTIIPLQENVTIGQRQGLSESDIIKLKKMYCEENTEDVKITHRDNLMIKQ